MMKSFNLIAASCAALLAFSSCDGLVDNSGKDQIKPSGDGDLVLSVSSSIIQANGEDAAVLTVLYDGVPVTEGVTLYDGDNNVVDLPSFTFTTEQEGTYSFWAAYGTSYSETVTVTAIAFQVPDLPEDPQPDSKSFAKKMLLTQFTGTGCGYCPGMINLLRTAMADDNYSSKIIIAAAHQYNYDDPAYLSSANLSGAMGITGFPTVVVDMYMSFSNYTSSTALYNILDYCYEKDPAIAGIAASSNLEDGTLVVTASVKAAKTSEFRIGAWLLEDGIYGKQSNYNSASWTGDYNTHDNCIRLADSKVSNTNYTGYSLGMIEAGKTAEHAFIMNVDDSWVVDNLHLVIFVTAKDGNSWIVNNAVACDVNGSVQYQYE